MGKAESNLLFDISGSRINLTEEVVRLILILDASTTGYKVLTVNTYPG